MPIDVCSAAAGVFIVDQVTKALVVRRCPPDCGDTRWPVWLRPVACRGWGFRVVPPPLLLLIWMLAALQIVILTGAGGSLDSALGRWGLGAALGGAAANFVDSSLRGAVVDFIDLAIWPTFNLADVAIVGGLACGLWSML